MVLQLLINRGGALDLCNEYRNPIITSLSKLINILNPEVLIGQRAKQLLDSQHPQE